MTRVTYPFLQSFDSSGKPLVGGKAYSYETGGTVPTETYVNSYGTMASRNPLVLDGNGKVRVFSDIDETAIKIVCHSRGDVAQWTNESIEYLSFSAPTKSIGTFKAYDYDGEPLVGGKVHTYVEGTSTEYTTYSDAALTNANANPVILNSQGEADIFCAATYMPKLILKDADDRLIWAFDFARDNVNAGGGGCCYDGYNGGNGGGGSGGGGGGYPAPEGDCGFAATDYQSGDYRDVWVPQSGALAELDYFYVANFHYSSPPSTGGLMSYTVDGDGTLNHIDTLYATTPRPHSIWGDPVTNHIYAVTNDGLVMYSVDANGTLIFRDQIQDGGPYSGWQDVWADGTYIYTVNTGSSGTGLRVYKNVLHEFEFVALLQHGILPNSRVWGDGTFIYTSCTTYGLACYSVSAEGVPTYNSIDDQGGTYGDLWGDGEFIYIARTGGISTYSVDVSGNLTHESFNSAGGNTGYIWGDGTLIYVGGGNGIEIYSRDASGVLTLTGSCLPAVQYGISGDGTFVFGAREATGLSSYLLD